MSELLEILSKLVAYRTFLSDDPEPEHDKKATLTPDHNFAIPKDHFACAKFIANQIGAAGLATEFLVFDGFPMVLGWHQPNKNSPLVCMLSHFDVVPADAEWEEAFSLAITEDKELGTVAVGRGVSDMKGPLSAVLTALPHIANIPHGNFCLAFTGDEEIGGKRGTGRLLSEVFLRRQMMPKYVITGDAQGEEVINVRRNSFLVRAKLPRTRKVVKGRKVFLRFETRVKSSQTSHAAYFRKEVDKHAVYEAGDYVANPSASGIQIASFSGTWVKSNVLPTRVAIEAVEVSSVEEMDFEIEESLTRVLKVIPRLQAVALPDGKSSLGTNITPNVFRFSEDHFEILIDLRAMAHASEKDRIGDLVTGILDQSGYQSEVLVSGSAGPIYTPEDSVLVQAAKKAWLSVTGSQTRTAERAGATDGRFFSHLGIDCIDFGGRGFKVHGTGETAVVSSLENLAKFYPMLLRSLGTLKAAGQ